jgi:hypothetical protein
VAPDFNLQGEYRVGSRRITIALCFSDLSPTFSLLKYLKGLVIIFHDNLSKIRNNDLGKPIILILADFKVLLLEIKQIDDLFVVDLNVRDFQLSVNVFIL